MTRQRSQFPNFEEGPRRLLVAAPPPQPAGGQPGWTEQELALLGKLPDGEVAARIGRTEGAVAEQRHRLRIPTADDSRWFNGRRGRVTY